MSESLMVFAPSGVLPWTVIESWSHGMPNVFIHKSQWGIKGTETARKQWLEPDFQVVVVSFVCARPRGIATSWYPSTKGTLESARKERTENKSVYSGKGWESGSQRGGPRAHSTYWDVLASPLHSSLQSESPSLASEFLQIGNEFLDSIEFEK